jgi:undecaprenyl-diphosphatase
MPADHPLTALASCLGANALAAYLAALAGLVLAIFLGAHLSRDLRSRPADGTPFATALLLALLGLGFSVIVGAALLFWAIAGTIGADQIVWRFDAAFNDALRASTSERTIRTFAMLTHLGDPLTLTLLGVVVAIVLLARNRRLLATGWIAALAGNALLNPTLKQFFERGRPLHDHGLALAEGWSFPSGHSSGAVVAYGMLAYVLVRTLPRAWHPPVVAASAAVALTTGCSRLFLQVHYPGDVLAGFASGTAWLAVCILSVELARTAGERARSRRIGG